MVFPDQHARRIREVIHVHSANVRVYVGKQVLNHFSSLGIQPSDKISWFSSRPNVARLVEYSVVRIDRPRWPLFELLRFRVEYSNFLGTKIVLSKPDLIVWRDIFAPRARIGRGRGI